MPTYEYRCPEGHEFELFQRMSEEPGAECPECGKAAERLLSAGAGFLFKGDGFYITDYRSDSYREREKAETKGSGAATENGSGPKEAGGTGGTSAAKGSAGDAGGATGRSAPKEGATGADKGGKSKGSPGGSGTSAVSGS